MTLTLFILSSLVAGIALIFKNILNDFPKIPAWMRSKLPFLIRKPFFCGFCFTAWTAFFATLLVDPLPLSQLTIRFVNMRWLAVAVQFSSEWMAVTLIAVLLRSLIIVFEELLHYLVHTVNGRPGDLH